MPTYADKSQGRSTRSVANAVQPQQRSAPPAFRFVDDRPEMLVQSSRQEMADDFSARQHPPKRTSSRHDVVTFERGLQQHLAALQNVGAGGQVVIQRQYAQANWTTMASYNGGSAAKEVTGAFGRAGYVIGPGLLNKVILPLMERSGFGSQRFAHGKGDEDSGHQGDTDSRVQECKNFLINWASTNPPKSTEEIGSSTSYTPTSEEMERHVEIKEEKRSRRKEEKRQQYLESQREEYEETEPTMSAYENPETPNYSKYLIEQGLRQGVYPPKLRTGSKEKQRYDLLVERYGGDKY